MEDNDKMNEFLSRLNPKIAKQYRKASETKTELLPMKSYGLTNALGGGIGRGRIALFYGNTSSGKSAQLMESAGLWQEMGLTVAYVDVEKTWDNKWAKRLGVNVDDLILIQRTSISKIYNDIRPLLEAGVDAIVIDSISMALPDAFIDEDGSAKDLENHKQIGAQAKALTALVNGIHYANESTAVAVISQTTTDLSGMHPKQIPNGGKKVLFASSQIVKLTSSGVDSKQIKGDIKVGNKIIQVPVGRTVQAYVEKNKIAPQGRTAEYNFYYHGPEVGTDVIDEVISEAIVFGVVEKGGAWLSYGDEKWQGRPALTKHVKATPGMLDEIKAALEKAKEIE